MSNELQPEKCLECERFFRSIKSHIKVHNMTVSQYREKYNNPQLNNPTDNPETQRKIRETVRKRYGVDCVSQAKVVKDKMKKTNLEKYGVEYISQVPETRTKVKQTNLERYGYISNLNMPDIKEKSQSIDARRKEHETKKKNGTSSTSKREKVFYALLCELFGENDIEYNVFMHRWEVDFYVKSIDAYIQFDGVYWHGLNSDINEIKKSESKRNIAIYHAYVKDREQDTWAKENNVKLVRITDEELFILSKNEIRDKLLNG